MKRTKHTLISILIITIIVIIGYAKSAHSQNSNEVKQETTKAEEIYKEQCARCHGVDGKGLESLQTPDFTDPKWQANQTDEKFRKYIEDGQGIMPSFKMMLTPDQITSLVKHVRAFALTKTGK